MQLFLMFNVIVKGIYQVNGIISQDRLSKNIR